MILQLLKRNVRLRYRFIQLGRPLHCQKLFTGHRPNFFFPTGIRACWDLLQGCETVRFFRIADGKFRR